MRTLSALCLALSVAACATAPNLDQAIAVHNTFRQVVLDTDHAFASVYGSIEPVVAGETAGNAEAYDKAMAPYKAVLSALSAAKVSENVLYSALSQWQAGKLDPGVAKIAYACAADAVQALSNAAGSMPSGSALYAVSVALQMELRTFADGAVCAPPEVSK